MLKSYLTKFLAFATLLLTATSLFAQLGTVTVTSPAGSAGEYYGRIAAFGPATFSVSGDVALADDGAGSTLGCTAITNVAGKIALIDRGTCGFFAKATNAQAAGAIALIVCNNNVGSPYLSIVMGAGAGDPTSITIPSMMLGYGDCLKIKAGLLDGVQATMNDGGVPAATSSQVCQLAETVTPGSYTIDSIVGGFGALFSQGATHAPGAHARWYAYTPTSTVLATVQTCGGFVDTRVWVVEAGADDCVNFGNLAGVSDDDCDEGAGFGAASIVNWLGVAGTKYYIVFDDRWDYHGFTWTLSEGAAPNVVAKVTVDMKNENINAAGAYIAGSFNAWTPEPMINNGDSTYSYYATVQAGAIQQWKYLNGPTGWENSPALEACGVPDGVGAFNRAGIINSLDSVEVLPVCFNSCEACPLSACAHPNAVICDNFDEYALGALNGQAPHWGIWTGGTDATVTADQASSGSQSIVVTNNNTTDLLLLLGNQTSGQWRLSWKMFIPTGKGAYYNLQESETPGVDWNLDAFFGIMTAAPNGAGTPGQGTVQLEGVNAATFTYPENTWFDVVHMIDLDKQQIRYFVNGKLVVTGAYQGQLGGVDFFSINTTNSQYYIDDVLYIDVPEPSDCDATYIICDGMEFYDAGTFTGPQADYWTTWSGTEGGAEDGIVSDEVVYEGLTSLKIVGQNGPQDVLLKLGNKSAGRYYLSWRMYIPTGENGYYNIQQSETAGVAWNLETQFNAGGTGSTTDGATFTFPHDTWFEVFHAVDLDNDVAYLIVDGAIAQAWNYTGNLGSIDFFATNVGHHLFYVDNVAYLQIPSSIGDYCFGAIDLNDYIGNGLGTVTTTPLYDNSNAGVDIVNFDPATGFECYLEPDGTGSGPSLDNNLYYSFVGDGNLYFIETGDCGSAAYITDGDTQISIYTGACGSLEPVAGGCVDDGPNAVPGNWIAGLEFQTEAGVTYYMSVDGFGGAFGEFCINFTQLSGSAPTFGVTLEVDMKRYVDDGGTISPAGIHVAGSFQGWDPAATALTQVAGTDKWTVTLQLEAGSYEYKFINGDAWGTCDVQQECLEAGLPCGAAGNDNRSITVAADMTAANCFDACGVCISGTEDVAFSQAISLQPNPADSYVNVVYDFELAADLNIRLVNNLGQLVSVQTLDKAQNGTLRLDLSTLPAGAYNVVFTNGEQVATKRLIVE